MLRRLPGPPRPDDRRAMLRAGRPGRAVRRRDPPHPPAELHPRHIPEARVDEVVRDGRDARLPARTAAGLRGAEHRLHRRSVLQLRGGGDQGEARTRSSSTWRALRRRGRRPAPQPGRLPARLRPPLDRRHRPPGDDAARARPDRRAARRATTSSCAAAWAGTRRSAARSLKRVPGDRGPLVIERLFRAYLDGRREGERIQQFSERHADEELVAICGQRPREDGSSPRLTKGTTTCCRAQRLQITADRDRDLLDDFEAGAAAVELDDRSPQEVMAWALERFGRRRSRSAPASRPTAWPCSTWPGASTPRCASSPSTPAACPRRPTT